MLRSAPTIWPPTQLSGAFTPSTAAHGAEVPTWARRARATVTPVSHGDVVVLSIWRRYADLGAYIYGGTVTLNGAADGYEASLELPKVGDHLRLVPDIAVTTLALYFDDDAGA